MEQKSIDVLQFIEELAANSLQQAQILSRFAQLYKSAPGISPSLFCRITQHAYDHGAAPQVEQELRSASVSAPKLIRVIRTNETLGYLDTRNLSSAALFDLLNEHFKLPFKLRCFRNYRSK